MSGKQYLKNQLAVILINLLGMLALALFLIASGNNIQTVPIHSCGLATCPCFPLLFFFFTRKKALDRLLNGRTIRRTVSAAGNHAELEKS